jgi:hypothetical protein
MRVLASLVALASESAHFIQVCATPNCYFYRLSLFVYACTHTCTHVHTNKCSLSSGAHTGPHSLIESFSTAPPTLLAPLRRVGVGDGWGRSVLRSAAGNVVVVVVVSVVGVGGGGDVVVVLLWCYCDVVVMLL